MIQLRKADAVAAIVDAERTLTARSVVASTLLGVDPPQLPARLLVRSGELFGIAEGTTRVAISRMAANGELVADDGTYRLAGERLVARQTRQLLSRAGERRAWDGTWQFHVVVGVERAAADRVAFRNAAAALRLAERREGLWLRPDNLTPSHDAAQPAARAVVDAQTEAFHGTPDGDPVALAQRCWDLAAWRTRAEVLRAAIDALVEPLQRAAAGGTVAGVATKSTPTAASADSPLAALSPAFVVSAAALRHFQLDPLLPDELVGDDWPGASLRADYDAFDAAFRAAWAAWFRAQP